MVEAGWLDAKCQIGLSGRTVPKTHHHLRRVRCGQFTAGMNHAETIVAINKRSESADFQDGTLLPDW